LWFISGQAIFYLNWKPLGRGTAVNLEGSSRRSIIRNVANKQAPFKEKIGVALETFGGGGRRGDFDAYAF
jgi:hypothetical protein